MFCSGTLVCGWLCCVGSDGVVQQGWHCADTAEHLGSRCVVHVHTVLKCGVLWCGVIVTVIMVCTGWWFVCVH